MRRQGPERTPWERTCPGFRRAIAGAIATGEIPTWVARHLNRCPSCRRGLAHVVASCTRLSDAGQGLAEQVAFVAKVRGLARDIATEREQSVTLHEARRQVTRWRSRLLSDWRIPAVLAVLVAIASAGLAAYLIVAGPSTGQETSPPPPPRVAPNLPESTDEPTSRAARW